MSKLVFKAEMFYDGKDRALCQDCATKAQAIYDKYVEGLPKVYGFRDDRFTELRKIEWDADNFMHTHTARLDAVEPLEGSEE